MDEQGNTTGRQDAELTEPIADDEAPLQIREAKGPAGGLGAIVSTARHAMEKMGAVRGVRTLLKLNQEGEFDCPGCAWPDPEDRTITEFCENGAKAVADEATKRRCGPEFFERWTVEELSRKSGYWLNRQGRLTHPMVLREGASRYQPIGWGEAFALIAEELKGLGSPDEAIFYTSGRTSNEAAFLYQLLVRRFGTNNLPDCSNMCHESSGTGLGEVIGIGKGTVQLEDFNRADLILVVGQNPGTNHPRMLTALQEAVRGGARVISVNPLREKGLLRFQHPQEPVGVLLGKGTQLSEQVLQVRINGDVALLKGLMKHLLDEEGRRPGEVLDHGFIEEFTDGYEALVADLEEVSWAEIEEATGLSEARIREAGSVVAASERIIFCWAMGLTQHKNGVANVQSAVNLLLLKGAIGKPGAGVCPVRGHSNVQGDRTMGIWERPSEAFLDRLGAEFDFEPPREHGLNVVEAIEAMHKGRARVFFAMGGNFISATPDTEYTAEALRRCRLTVQVSTKLNRSHLVTGRQALILPCLGRTERDVQAGRPQFVSVENSMGVVHLSKGHLPPASDQLLSEPRIVARLGEAVLGPGDAVPWARLADDYDRIRARIERVVPGFEQYNTRVLRPSGFLLPNPARERVFRTATGKARFTVHPIPRHELADGELMMMTLRSHDQYNTTIYGHDDRYRGLSGNRRVVLMHRDDIRAQGLRPGQEVDLVSGAGEGRRVAPRFVVVPYDIPRRCAATYFPETNILVPIDSYADRSYTPTSKSIIITLEPR